MVASRLRPNTSRLRLVALVVAAVAFILFLSANGVAGMYTDWLWFDRLDQGTIWYTILQTKTVLVMVFTFAFFLLFWGNLVLAERMRPESRPVSAEDDLVERYHQAVGNQGSRVRIAISVLFALVAGANTSTQWESWLLFRNGGDFGWADPLFGRDAGFYVFRLPFLSFFIGWLFAALILTLVVVVIAHYLNGGIRAAAPGDKVMPGVKLQVSVLLAALAVLRAIAYYLDRFALVRSTRGDYDGALATDVTIQEPAYNLLALISLACAAVFIYNIRRSGWSLPAIAIGIWLLSHFAVGSIFPMVYQRLRVVPDKSQREAPFVGYNIEATRFAYGLDADSMVTYEVDYESGLTAEDLEISDDVLSNVPVVDPALAVEEVSKSEGERKIYSFSDRLDIDRYEIDGEQRPVVLSARGLNIAETGSAWESQHVIFTHGYGMAMAGAYDEGLTSSGVGEQRELNFIVKGLGETEIDPTLDLSLEQPRIYYGDQFPGYAIVGAARAETDYQTGDNQSIPFNYDGEGGVPMGSSLRRLAFALRFRQIDPLVSRNVTDRSRVIYNRDVMDRARELAPFLRFDQDPYPIVADGRILWMLDGYTTTDDFPYSQSARPVGLSTSADLSGGYNYVRDSVKIVVDSYDGGVTMYVVDEEDPILAAWRNVFPDLFTDASEMPESVLSHLRYPQDIFSVQTQMWSSYVVDDATDFIEGALAWGVANQPRPEAQGNEGADPTPTLPMDPQYLMARLPSSESAEFVLQRAFVPTSGADGTNTARPELTALMMARSDPENYGELVLFRLPAGEVNAPDRVHSEIRKNDDLTNFIKEKAGAQVEFGEMSIVLVGNTIVYVRPVYVEANSATAVPELQRVIVVNGDRIAMAGTVEDALRGAVSGPSPANDTTDPDPRVDADGSSVVGLIAEARLYLETAEGIAEDDPLEADRLRALAADALQKAGSLLGGTSEPETTSNDT